jgi:hypothetical protein
MALTKSTVAVNNISSLSATPNATEGLTAAQLQAKFDKTGSDIKAYLNDTLTAEIDALFTTSASGWTILPATLTYASASRINTSVDLTGVIGIGDKIKLTQNSAKYFYVIAITSNLLTVTGGSDYTVENATITSPYYSHTENPFGFPNSLGGFIIEATTNANGSYEKYIDGRLVQMGIGEAAPNENAATITLPTAFVDTNYLMVASHKYTGGGDYGGSAQLKNIVAPQPNNTTTAYLYSVYSDGSVAAYKRKIQYIAYGKWK